MDEFFEEGTNKETFKQVASDHKNLAVLTDKTKPNYMYILY